MARKLDRRTLLRGMLGGTAVALGLPALEAFLNDNGTAHAQATAFPKRFGLWFWGNGIGEAWQPATTGPLALEGTRLAPLAAVQQHLTVVSGLKCYQPNVEPHGTGPRALLTGSTGWEETLDQRIAGMESAQGTAIGSLNVTVERTDNSISRVDRDQINPPEHDPIALYRTFTQNFVQPGAELDPRYALRKSVLSAVKADADRLRGQVSAADRIRIEQHFDNVRKVENSLQILIDNPPNFLACGAPAAPPETFPDVGGRLDYQAIARAHSDILVMALACNMTQVFTFQMCAPVSNILFPDATKGFHVLTHEELGEQLEVRSIVQRILAEYAYLVNALAQVPEGDGTLLDNCCILGFSDCEYGKSHSVDNYPVILAGGAGGALQRGIHYRSTAENISKLGLTLLQVFGSSTASFGAGQYAASEPLGAILT